MGIGDRLAQLRQDRRLTQAALAELADLSREYVLRIEAGLHDPTLSNAARLAQALGVSLDDLLKPASKSHRSTKRRRTTAMTATQRPFEEALAERLRIAQEAGLKYLDVSAKDLHRQVGGYPGPDHRMPVCCSVMERQKRLGDQTVSAPPSGKGATLTIRYKLPR